MREHDAAQPREERYREAVVRRLLARGLCPATLMALLPDFRPIIESVSEDH